MEEQKVLNLPTVKDSNALFLISMFLFVGVGEVINWITPPASYLYKMLLTVLIQFGFVLLPALIYIYFKKWDIRSTLRFNKISIANGILASAIILFAIPITSFINFIVIIILKYFGKLQTPPVFPSENLPQLFLNLFVIALIPALFEETLFRGVVMRGYEKYGNIMAIVISSLLFALLHRSLQTLIGTFILGIVIAYIVYRTNSIFSGMIAHFTNNAFVVILTFGLLKLQKFFENNIPNFSEQLKSQSEMQINNIPIDQLVYMLILLAVMSVFFGIVLTGLIILFRYTTKDIVKVKVSEEHLGKEGFSSYLPLALGLLLVLYKYVEQLI